MACFVNVMAAFSMVVVVGSIVICQKELEIEKDENVEPFSLLCRIYNVAKNPPINHVDLEEPNKIVEEIDTLNTSMVELQLLNNTEQVLGSDVAGNDHSKINIAATKETAVAQFSLNHITQRAHNILEEIKKINITKEIEKAYAEFNKVIFGDGGNESELCQAKVKDLGNRSEACGKPGEGTKGSHSGKNLVVDFFCLCSRNPDEQGVNQVCGFYVGVKDSKIGWNESDLMGSPTMWASIKGGCGKYMHQHPKSTAEARHILDQFLKHLKTGGVYRWGTGKNIEGSSRKEGMLGTGVGTKSGGNGKDVLCDGKKGNKGQSPGGVCVYYGTESDSWETNIPWLKPLKTALASVDVANNQTASIQRVIKKLQMLLHRAEEIYETTKVMTEIKNNVGVSAFQNKSGNLTAFNTTRIRSYSHSSHRYFIPAWVLLL